MESQPPPHRRIVTLVAVLGLAATLAPASLAPVAAAEPGEVTVVRYGGEDRYATAVKITQRLLPGGDAPVVYLASGETFPDAVSAGPLAAAKGGAVLLTRRDFLPAVVEAELVRLSPARVIVAGGASVVGDTVVARVRSLLGSSVPVKRVAGSDRYATSAALSADGVVAGSAPTVFLAPGHSFPDALSAGPIAGGAGAPVLLTRQDRLPAAISAELRRLKATKVVVVGGPSVVGSAVVSAVSALGLAVERVAGADRFGTAAAVAGRFRPEATTVVVATGLAFPDALAAVPLATSLAAPILLVRPDSVPPATRDRVIALGPTAIVAAGGGPAVGSLVLHELVGWSDGRLEVLPPTPGYPSFDSRYHDYNEMVTAIKVLEIAFPGLIDVFSVGKSHHGRDIWAAKISDNVATDEDEPEVLVDALHHAREHLTVEQGLYLARLLTTRYASDTTVRRLVDSRETWIIFALNPDGWAYDLGGSPYRGWRKTRQPIPGSSYVGIDPNRNYDYKWGCCGGSSGSPSAWNYRGWAPFVATETVVLRDFVNSRVIDGEQQIRTHVTLHTNGELILYPPGYTKTDVPSGMPLDDQRTFVAMAGKMAASNGYTAQQSSDLYVTDGDQIDWMYFRHGIFSFTFELYPTEQVSSHADHEPPDEVIATQTARNRGALLYLIDAAACPYAAIGKAATYCP